MPKPKSPEPPQPTFDLPLSKAGVEAVVRAHVTAWLTDGLGRVLPSCVLDYVRVRHWGRDRYAARVRLFDGTPATIFVQGAPKRRNGAPPVIRQDGGDFYFHGANGIWQRAAKGETQEAVAERLGYRFS